MGDLPAVPDYFGQFVAPIQRQQQLGIEQQNSDLQRQQLQMEQQQQAMKLRQQALFQQDAASVIANPTPQGFQQLFLKHPEMHEGLKAAWDQYSDGEKQRDTSQAAQVYAALSNGRSDLALQLLKDRKAALANSGGDDKTTDALIDMVESGDPEKVKQAQAISGFALATSTGQDHIASTLEALGGKGEQYTLAPGDIRYDEAGRVVAQSPYLKAPDGSILERDTAGGPTHAASAATGGTDAAIGHVLKNEGGYNPKDANGSPTNFGINFKANRTELAKIGITAANFKNMTKDQAEQIYAAKYWPASGADKLPANLQAPYFDAYVRSPAIAKRAYAQSGGDPQKFVQIASATFQKMASNPNSGTAPYAKAWANRDAGNMAIATGSTATDSAPSAVPGYHVLVPASKGPPSGYETDPTRPGALRPIPGGPADPDGVKNAGPLKPDALRTATVAYIKTGKMPAGMGGQSLKNQILNYVPQIMDEHGLTPDDMPSIQQQFGADSAAFKQRIGQLSYMRQSVGKLNQHAQDLSALIKAVPAQVSFKPFNWITQGIAGQFSNSTVTQLQAGLPLFEAEVARVMTGNPNSGSGQLSDSARHEFGILSSPVGPSAKIDAVNRIMKMTEEAVKSTRDETVTLKHRIGGGIDVYAGNGGPPKSQPQDDGWTTLPSGLKIRKIR